MGKKDAAEMAKQREIFMAGAAERKFPKAKAGELFDLMEKFAGYGFNKSHSAAYSLLAYHTAWLKTHYPVEFMAALLTIRNLEARQRRQVHLRVPRDEHPRCAAQRSGLRRQLHAHRHANGKAIGFGLAAIKNVGHNAIESIITARAALQAAGKQGFASL